MQHFAIYTNLYLDHVLLFSGDRNYYGLRPGEPEGPKPQWAKWGPPGSIRL